MSRSIQLELELERTMHKEAKNRLIAQNKELDALRTKIKQLENGPSNSIQSSPKNQNPALASLVSKLQQAVIIVDENFKVIKVNENCCKKFGIKNQPDSLTGSDGTILLRHIKNSFKDSVDFIATLEKIIGNKKELLNNELLLDNGLTCSCDYIPVINEGAYKGYIFQFTDVTRNKTISETFDTQRKFYEQILNNIPADIIVLNTEGKYLFVNPAAVSKPDLRKWMIGKSQEEYNEYANKPFEIRESRKKVFEKILATKNKMEWEEKLTDHSGEDVYFLRVLYPVLDVQGNVGIAIGYGVNITERKIIEKQIQLSEEKYRGIIENMNLGMLELDAEERIIYANQRFCTMSGYSVNELKSKKATDLFLQGASLKRTRNQLSKGQFGITNSFELEVKTKTGVTNWWLTSATPLYNADETQKGTISIHLDITEQKKLEDQLRVAKMETERSSKSKDIFLTNMSHEIRTPLNAIMGLGKLLSKSNLNKDQKNYLNGIENASANLLGIVNDLLDISKIEAGKISIEFITFNLETIFQQAVNVLEHNAEGKGLALTHEIDHRISPVLIGDPFRLNQVFMNMISNAIKFTNEGSVSLRAFLIEERDGYQKILVAIEDTGVGIKEEYLKTIFDKFTQEDETVVRNFGGTGLGMSITKQLMELMGGTIAIDSKKNVGTTISLTFSFKIGTARVFEKKRTIKNDTYNINGKKILLVEDNNLNRLLATTILGEYGAVVMEAENGLIAVEMMRKYTYDIVLMDIQMPVMDGIKATQIIRKEINNTIPIIALTANAVKTQEHKFFEAGMNDLISKPYNELNLVNPIAKWLNTRIDGTTINEGSGTPLQTQPQKDTAQTKEPEAPVTPQKALYDLAKLQAIGRNDNNFTKKMLELFIAETPGTVAKIKEGYAAKDQETIKFYAHRLKPSIGNLGITSIKDDVLKIELSKEMDANLGSMITKVDKVIAAVIEQMKIDHAAL